MSDVLSDFRNEVFLKATLSAFFRDSLPNNYQLHWYFSGQCEAFSNSRGLSRRELVEAVEDAGGEIEQLGSSSDWRTWNIAYGLFDGFAQAIAELQLLEFCEKSSVDLKLMRAGHRLPQSASNFEMQLEKTGTELRAYTDLSLTPPMICQYLLGKLVAVETAKSLPNNSLTDRFRSSRIDEAETQCREVTGLFHRGRSAGFGEAAAMAKFADTC